MELMKVIMKGTRLSRIISYGHPGGSGTTVGERRRKKAFRRWLRKKEKLEFANGIELNEEIEFSDRLAAELAKWGWGDFHYGPQAQERSVADLVEEHRLRRNGIDEASEGRGSSTR